MTGRENAPLVCAIGTTDPWNAAGLGLDVRALAECGARAAFVVAGVSAQDARGLHALHEIPAETIEAQFDALADAPIAAYRVGALPGVAAIATVAARLRDVGVPVVYDPVFGPSGGGAFVDHAGVAAIVRDLIPCVTIVTPNLEEARRLAGLERCDDVETMALAARTIVSDGAGAALVKGGHLAERALDVLFDGELRVFEERRIDVTMRGTGCLLADALAAALAKGQSLREAVAKARAYVREKIERALKLGSMRVLD
jgi:hydroxymethylpyrimidine kinase/phosphomethylpyrimidine kinase